MDPGRELFPVLPFQVPGIEVDLFTTSTNHQLPAYIAPNVDPGAAGMDALSIDWNRWKKTYMFPPVNLPMKALDKLRTFQGTAAIVAPLWP